jgi:hypothetical protein
MTNDEIRRQKADLLLEHQEAEHELANLREKGLKLMENYETVIKAIKGVSTRQYASSISEGASAHAGIRANLESYREVIDIDKTLAVIDQIESCSAKVRELAERKTSLGLK